MLVAGLVVSLCIAAPRPAATLHHEFASRAAAVDGEMTDVVGNMVIVKAFGGLLREHRRFDTKVEQEMSARRQSLLLPRAAANHARARHRGADPGPVGMGDHPVAARCCNTGDVILVCTLGLSVLHATRDLAVALVDVTQHMARFSEALSTLLVPHQLCDRPGAPPSARAVPAYLRGRDVRLSRLPHDLREPRLPHRRGSARGPGRRLRRRQVHALRPGAALL